MLLIQIVASQLVAINKISSLPVGSNIMSMHTSCNYSLAIASYNSRKYNLVQSNHLDQPVNMHLRTAS